MMYAKEARKITAANKDDSELKAAVEKLMPAVSAQIQMAAERGLDETFIKKADISRIVGFVLIPHKMLMDALAAEVREYGYEVWNTDSYSSIHFKW